MTLSVRKTLLVLIETLALLAVVIPFAHLRTVLQILQENQVPPEFSLSTFVLRGVVVVAICQITFFFNDLYEWKVIRSKHQSSIRLLESCSYSLILLALLYFAFDGFDRIVLKLEGRHDGLGVYKLSILPALLVITLTYLTAYGYRRAFDWTQFRIPFADRLLLVGDGPIAEIIEKELHERADPGYTIVGYIVPTAADAPKAIRGHRVLGGYDALLDTVKRFGVHRVIVTLPERRGNLPVLELLNCRLQGTKVEEGELLYERLTGKIAVGKLRPSYLIFSEGFNRSKFTYIFKRALDLLLAAVGLLVSIPITILTAIAIKLESRGPVLFSQPRVGREGRIFKILKFRSMREDAEKESGPVWATSDDHRITRVGRIIRKLRIDEIPQLVNVLRNEMSFAGPRPERPFFVEELKKDIPYYTERLVVKPGITGWAQINYRYGASREDALEKLQYDLYYIKNMSIFLDVVILFRTVKVVLLGFGAR